MVLVHGARFAAILAFLTMPALGAVLYSNGTVNGTIGAAPAYNPDSTSDTFVLSSASTLTGLSNVGIWVLAGDTLSTLDWTISSAADGAGIVEGSAAAVSPFSATELLPTGSYGSSGAFNVYNVSFSLPNLNLAAGTYYLTLANGVASNSAHPVYWDDSGGPSSGAIYVNGSFNQNTPSNSFEVDGVSTTPEPGSLILFGAGIAALIVKKKIDVRRQPGESRS